MGKHMPSSQQLILTLLIAISVFKASQSARPLNHDLTASESIARNEYKAQSVAPRSSTADTKKYGYPFQVAPTLFPIMHSRSDGGKSEAKPLPKLFNKVRLTDEEKAPIKKSNLKKHKHIYTRRQGYQKPSNYKVPKYRIFEGLESTFLPRRMDVNIPYSTYYRHYSDKKPPVSPRDPYLSPSNEPVDSFYPSSGPGVYASVHGTRAQPAYGAVRYDNSYHENENTYPSDELYHPPSYSPNNSPYHDDYPQEEEEDYIIEKNQPITGDIRKRLLQHSGAKDMYEDELDYLQDVLSNKNKYGPIGNDYYQYGGPVYRRSYSEFPYVESKVRLEKRMSSVL